MCNSGRKSSRRFLSIIVQYELYGDDHTYAEITGNGSFNTHYNSGNVLYGIEMFVDPEFRSLRLGRRLYDARKELCENLNLKSIVIGGRIPKYFEYKDELTLRQYIQKVRKKRFTIRCLPSSFPTVFSR